jgi:hypothetical protein
MHVCITDSLWRHPSSCSQLRIQAPTKGKREKKKKKTIAKTIVVCRTTTTKGDEEE